MTDAAGEPTPAARPRWTVRQRLMTMVVGLLALGLLLTGLLSFTVQYQRVVDQINDDLVQEVDELGLLAQAGPGRDGRAYVDVDDLFYDFIATSTAGEDEAFMGLVQDRPMFWSGGERAFEVQGPDVVSAVTALSVPEGEARITSLRTQGTTLRVLAADVRLDGEERQGTFVVAIDLGSQQEEMLRRVLIFVLVSVVVMALGAALAHVVLGRLLRPLRDLQEATAEVSTTDLSRRVDVAGADTDVVQLGVRFNQMLDRIEAGVGEQRQFLDDAAHELRTPLTILRGNAELLDPHDPEEVTATRTLMLDEVDRMQRLVDDLLVLAKAQRPDFVRTAPTDVTELAVECMDRLTSLGDRRWRLSTDAEGQLDLDRQRIIQAVVQLAANGVKFSEPGSVVELTSRWADADGEEGARAVAAGARPADRYLALSVLDQGCGIPEEQLSRIFERFGRADNASRVEGSGLGLAIVEAIVQAHGGAAAVESVEGVGSRFTLWLPDGPERDTPTG
ncbi:sensor histidine kinase [Ornithinimicrobium flavum]|uniref:sensor histidine kinase n=1 Tax=Ornithinimicrobium flavum TaxID=1288636 RepID=UPI00106F6B6C|nr:HAMP domain-containing sensor histidine kinase [Ornithinimicrobium flavum]